MPKPSTPHKRLDTDGKRIPVRTCVVSRERRPQSELLRVVRTANGWQLDPKRRVAGRGAYISPDRPELHTVKALRRFARGEAETLAALLEAYRAGKIETTVNTVNDTQFSQNTVGHGVSKQGRLWKNKPTEVTDG